MVLLLLFCSAIGKKAIGQDYPWSLQYVTNMHTINPAYVGIWDRAGLMVSTKTTWVGIGGAPISQYIGYYTPIKDQKSGVGISIQRTNIGLEKRLSITGDYSYQLRTDMYHYLRFGLRAGIVNFDNNLTKYQTYPDRIPDPEFTTDVRIYNMTTLGIGTVFFTQDYYVSLSMPQIINNTFQVNRAIFSSLQSFRTVYLSAGYVFNLRRNVRFRPNLLLAGTIGQPVYVDLAGLVYLPSNLQLGVNLRSTGTICLSAQYTFKNRIRIGYASDYAVISDIRKYQIGTYEILIGYDFNITKRKYSRPNYF